MRVLLLSVILVTSACACDGQSLRRIDFKNFEYSWDGPSTLSDNLAWLNVSQSSRVRLVDGRWSEDEAAVKSFRGLTFEQVQFGDVTGDGREEAIVVLRFDTGGTQYFHYVFIYSLEARQPRLLAYFRSGERAYYGLYKVYAHAGKLVVELFDPEKRQGDCCSSRYIRTRYRWRDGAFVRSGVDEFGTPTAPSRIPVSIFGNHK